MQQCLALHLALQLAAGSVTRWGARKLYYWAMFCSLWVLCQWLQHTLLMHSSQVSLTSTCLFVCHITPGPVSHSTLSCHTPPPPPPLPTGPSSAGSPPYAPLLHSSSPPPPLPPSLCFPTLYPGRRPPKLERGDSCMAQKGDCMAGVSLMCFVRRGEGGGGWGLDV